MIIDDETRAAMEQIRTQAQMILDATNRHLESEDLSERALRAYARSMRDHSQRIMERGWRIVELHPLERLYLD